MYCWPPVQYNYTEEVHVCTEICEKYIVMRNYIVLLPPFTVSQLYHTGTLLAMLCMNSTAIQSRSRLKGRTNRRELSSANS